MSFERQSKRKNRERACAMTTSNLYPTDINKCKKPLDIAHLPLQDR